MTSLRLKSFYNSHMARKIIHLDLDAFFCAVEEQRDPSLQGKPFAVGGRPEQRGVVSSCSYAARQCGVRSAMPMGRALRQCPGLIIVSGHYARYSEASRQVMDILRQYTPLVEQVSIDEAFLDLSDLPEAVELLAHQIQAAIHEKVGLPCSLGAASNKLVAKIATDAGKAACLRAGGAPHPPNAITVVPPGEEAAFLRPLPVQALWGVGPKTAERLQELGIHTIGELADCPAEELVRLFGKHGAGLSCYAHGSDDSPIVTEHEAKSISQETTFARDVRDPEALRKTLRQLSEQVGRALRKAGLKGRTVKLKLRWHDFTTLTRQVTLSAPCDLDEEIYQAALGLFEGVWKPGGLVRLLGVGVSHFEAPPARQLSLWEGGTAERQRLQQALDELQERYGKKTIRRGAG
jgi:DNA polymerase-4